MSMYVTGTASFPQQLHVFIAFNLYCVHNNIDSVQPKHKTWCINCVLVLPYHLHHPHQVRTTLSFSLAILHTCDQYEQPVSNKNACVQWNELASNMICMYPITTTLHVGAGCSERVPNGYTFVPLVDSPGNTIGTRNNGSIQSFASQCNNSRNPECVGFNSSGDLKSSLLPTASWIAVTNDPCLGLYVRNPPN